MKGLIIFLLLAVFSINAYASDSYIKQIFPFKYDKPQNPDPEELSIVYYILEHTYENNIHKMRGENDNRVYTSKNDGQEYVFDKNNNPVRNYNVGSYNYATYDAPINKFIMDIAPWIVHGSAPDDPTSVKERLYYYTFDLNNGIQEYIFKGSKEKLEEVVFNELSESEKEVYYAFLHLLFNEKYKVKLNSKDIERLRDDAKYYTKYFFQIQDALGVKQ